MSENFTVIDTETGGFDPARNGICSIACKSSNNKELYLLIQHHKSLKYGYQALKTNGFRPIKRLCGDILWRSNNPYTGKVEIGKGLPEGEALIILLKFLEENNQNGGIAGANIRFDVSFLLSSAYRANKESKHCGILEKMEKAIVVPTKIELANLATRAHLQGIIDLPILKKGPKTGLPSVSLNSVAEAMTKLDKELFTLSKETSTKRKHQDVHNALEDVRITKHIIDTLQYILNNKKEVVRPQINKTPEFNF